MKRILGWAAALAVTTILFGTIYVVAQQLDRASADDAPLRLATQVASEIRSGQSATIGSQPHVDLSRSLALFVVLENAQGQATGGSGFLDGTLVSLPNGVLTDAASSGRDSVTWEPGPGLRFATVTVPVDHGFVTAGQSLAPSEDRDATTRTLVGLSWLAALVVLSGTYLLRRKLSADDTYR